MPRLEDLGEILSSDVLVIGGGISGLCAAIRARESGAEVLLIDKQTVGWAGKAGKGGGFLIAMSQDDDVEEFVEYHVRNLGYYLNDQDLLASYAKRFNESVEQLSAWGAKVGRKDGGDLDLIRCPFFNPRFKWRWSIAGVDLDVLTKLRARARKVDVQVVNKVQVVDLIRHGEKIVGAVGFNLLDGQFCILRAKATILANGSCNYKAKRMWHSGCGDGISAAYRAGAEMRNAEFGNFFDVHRLDNDGPGFDYTSLYNAKGENIYDKYATESKPDITIDILLGMEKEVREGRGPIYFDPSSVGGLFEPLSHWNRPQFARFHGYTTEKELKFGPAPTGRVEVTAALNAELSPIRVDHEMRSSVPGLWATGDSSLMGSACVGAVFAPPGMIRGIGLGNSVQSALRAAPSAATFAAENDLGAVKYQEVRKLKENMFAPMQRETGFTPEDAIRGVQEVVCKFKYNLRRRGDRLEEGLRKIEEVTERLSQLWAKDGHGLCKCHEARSLATCAEMTMRAALERTESRGTHYREDYPERDDQNWLKWTIIKEKSGKMAVSTEPVPIEDYKYRP